MRIQIVSQDKRLRYLRVAPSNAYMIIFERDVFGPVHSFWADARNALPFFDRISSSTRSWRLENGELLEKQPLQFWVNNEHYYSRDQLERLTILQ